MFNQSNSHIACHNFLDANIYLLIQILDLQSFAKSRCLSHLLDTDSTTNCKYPYWGLSLYPSAQCLELAFKFACRASSVYFLTSAFQTRFNKEYVNPIHIIQIMKIWNILWSSWYFWYLFIFNILFHSRLSGYLVLDPHIHIIR